MERILVFDNYDSFTYNLVHLIEKISDAQVDVMRNDQIALDDVAAYNRIVLSPGPGIPSEAGLLLPLIQRFWNQKPMLGVCLGHQAIAEALGGSLRNLDHVFHGVASPLILEQEAGFLFQGISTGLLVGRYHSWVVEKLPAELRVTARDEQAEIMAFQHDTLPLAGVQFHPESIMTEQGELLLQNFLCTNALNA
ncbi:MAG: anthranilate synthase component II [Bacteroidia bacterium]